MTFVDQIVLALCAWKENRNHGLQGMKSVMNVIINRSISRKESIYAVVFEYLQFTSMTYHRDPEYTLRPDDNDPMWIEAQMMASQASKGQLEDITGGALNYYATSIPQPYWAKEMTFTVEIGGHAFYKEKTTQLTA